MRFRSKILAVLTVVGLLPLVLLGLLSFSVNRAELERTASATQEALAQEAARGAEHWVARGVEGLRLSVSILPFEQLRPQEVSAALHIPYGQLEFVDALALVDDRARLAGPLVTEARKPSSRPPFPAEDLSRFLAAAPVELAMQAGTALGAPYLSSSGEPHVAVAVRVSMQPPRAVAAQFSLRELQQDMQEIAHPPAIAFLATAEGGVLANAGAPEAPRAFGSLATAAVAARAPFSRTMQGTDGRDWLASAAPVGGMGWAVGVAQPAGAAFSGAARVRHYTIFWMGVALLLTALLGAHLSRGLSQPVRQLTQGVRALAEGRYDQKVLVDSGDELGQLAGGFNQMAREIRRRDEEIRAWNAELQQRVEHRTAELKMAQDQILRNRRLAAIGSLGAGIAHELNNPLTAVAGLISLARKQLGEASPQADTLKQALEQARRVSKIVGDLRQFSEQERTHGGRRFPLSQPVQSALDLYA